MIVTVIQLCNMEIHNDSALLTTNPELYDMEIRWKFCILGMTKKSRIFAEVFNNNSNTKIYNERIVTH